VTDPFIRRVSQSLMDSTEILTDEMVRRVVSEDPFYAQATARSQDDVRADVGENLGQILRGLAGLEPLDFDLARTLARRRAEQGVPVAALLHAYRVAAQVLWDHHLAAGHLLGMSEFDLDQILDGAAELWALTNTYCSVISQAYDDIATERGRRSERTRMLLLDALFEGRVEDLPPLTEMSRLLDLPEREPFAVVIAEVRPPADEGIPRVEQVLRHAGLRSTWRVTRHRQIGVVVVDGARGSLDGLRKILAERATGRVGLSPIYADLTETSRQVSLADLALCCVPRGDSGVVLFDEQPVGALIARSPELSERVAALVLGPVLALDRDEREILLGTLSAWIEEAGSVARAAARLYCHRNTVRNRLQRIETLTERSLTDPVGVSEIYVAVTAARQTPGLDP
jgi:PucR C-terminal helix-turn-helix domain/GGDEF-like domain